jgi:hypothetical protein
VPLPVACLRYEKMRVDSICCCKSVVLDACAILYRKRLFLEAISYYQEEEEEEPIGGLFLSIYYDLPLAKRRRRTTQQTAFARDNKNHMI